MIIKYIFLKITLLIFLFNIYNFNFSINSNNDIVENIKKRYSRENKLKPKFGIIDNFSRNYVNARGEESVDSKGKFTKIGVQNKKILHSSNLAKRENISFENISKNDLNDEDNSNIDDLDNLTDEELEAIIQEILNG